MGDLPLIIGGATAGLQIGSGLLRAHAARENAEAVARAAEYNARLATSAAHAEEKRLRRKKRRTLSSQRVAFAKAGVRLEGSPLETLAYNAAELELDAVNARIAGANTAALERARAEGARVQGEFLAGTSLLSGLTRAAGTGLSLLPRRK